MDVVEAIHGRRSIRAEPVERTLIEDLIRAAVQAPTPPVSGDTPWAFCVIEGVRHLADYGARAKQYALDHQAERSNCSNQAANEYVKTHRERRTCVET